MNFRIVLLNGVCVKKVEWSKFNSNINANLLRNSNRIILVIIFYKSKSLIPCIITHAVVNSLSIFSEGNKWMLYIVTVFIVVVSLSYAFYINRTVEE